MMSYEQEIVARVLVMVVCGLCAWFFLWESRKERIGSLLWGLMMFFTFLMIAGLGLNFGWLISELTK